MAKCSQCKTNQSTIRAMIQGVYYSDLCAECKAAISSGQSVSSGHARWTRTIDAEDHEADIQQPRNKDGTPNGRFVRMYPEQARAVLTDEEMRKAV
jgi:hypothetical protein